MQYSDKIMEHFLDPQNRQTLSHADGTGVAGIPGSGPFVVFQIIVRAGVVEQAAFQSHNCGVAIASGSMLTIMVKGLTLSECREITSQSLDSVLDGVPSHKLHTSEFAVIAMKNALEDVRP